MASIQRVTHKNANQKLDCVKIESYKVHQYKFSIVGRVVRTGPVAIEERSLYEDNSS